MIRLPLVRRSDDDDYAPVDYSAVRSLAEGQRLKESQVIHRNPMDPVIRHRVDPYERGTVDEYGTRTRRSPVVRKPSNTPVRRGLPSLAGDPAPVERAAYPQEVSSTPPEPEIPEWLRVARQNAVPQDDRSGRSLQITAPLNRPEPQDNLPDGPARRDANRRPRVGGIGGGSTAPPRSAASYEEAGYPPELLQLQYQQEQARLAEELGSGRHGAQRYHVCRTPRAPAQAAGPYAPPNAYAAPGPPSADDPHADAKPRRNIPWLGIAGLTLMFLAVGLWLMGMSFTNQKNLIIRSREAAAEAIQNSHPYSYRQLIETQAQIQNLHPAYIAAIVLNESSFKPTAESRVGARGLMQIMPDTAEWVHGKIGQGQPYSFDSMYDPDTNVRYACWYLNFLSERFRGDPVLVAAAFHAGQNTVQNWLNDSRYSADSRTIALEDMPDGPTKNYAARVMQAYAVYRRLYYEDPKYGG